MMQVSKRFALVNGQVVLPKAVESGKAVACGRIDHFWRCQYGGSGRRC